MKNIKPELPGGFKDYLPQEQIYRKNMINKVIETFEKFSFIPTDTPAIEKRDILTSGDNNFDKELLDLNKEGLSLRFDLTVPLARLIATYPEDIDKPFRRYQIGRVWRGEKPQRGRYREFLQCDIDIVGTNNLLADAEILSVVSETMTTLGFEDHLIRINNRKLLNGLMDHINVDDGDHDGIFRILDKVEKIGWEEVRKELKVMGLEDNNIATIKDFLDLSGNINDLKSFVDSQGFKEGVEELGVILDHADKLGVPKSSLEIDTSIVRGLGYYTGMIFETTLNNSDIGSVFSGGRYDNLIERFSNSPISAVGASLGLDRLFASMEDKEKEQEVHSGIMVLNFEPECEEDVLDIVKEFRKEGIKTSIYLGNDNTIKGQISHAANLGYPLVCLMGKKEKEKNIVQLKDMKNREQHDVSRSEVIAFVRSKI